MLILAIESSCDETSAAIVDMSEKSRVILSNIVASQTEIHALYGGVVPEIASRAHIDAISYVTKKAVKDAGVDIKKLDAVAVTCAPGLIGPLLVGVNFAKSLAYTLKLPLIPVNHILAHSAAAYFDYQDLCAPFIAITVSGSHTSIYKVTSFTAFEEIGTSRDDAAGEAFDKVGRVMGLNYPCGAAIDRLASEWKRKGSSQRSISDEALKFPSPAIKDSSLDFSFSGLKTAVINHIHNLRQRLKLDKNTPLPENECQYIASAFTDAVCAGIAGKLDIAIKKTGINSILLAGGVAANSHLREAVKNTAESHGGNFYVPSLSLCGDNAAMVGAQAYYEYMAGKTAGNELNAYASEESAYLAGVI